MHKEMIVIILTRNQGWRCRRTIFSTTTRRNLKVGNWRHKKKLFMNSGGLPLFILNDGFWKNLKFVIPLTKFIADGLRRRFFKRACFLSIRYLNSHFYRGCGRLNLDLLIFFLFQIGFWCRGLLFLLGSTTIVVRKGAQLPYCFPVLFLFW